MVPLLPCQTHLNNLLYRPCSTKRLHTRFLPQRHILLPKVNIRFLAQCRRNSRRNSKDNLNQLLDIVNNYF
jgi:hypothetical protein